MSEFTRPLKVEMPNSTSQAHRSRIGSISSVSIKTSTSCPLKENTLADINNSVAHTEKGYLPEAFLPEFLDLVIWGHEHECLIDPRYNSEMNFHVMQPGSSVATSLMPGEAVPKHVAVLSITGRDFAVETIRLKTVRPFVMREIVLSEEKEAMKLAKKANNRTALTQFLTDIVDDMIEQAIEEWKAAQGDELDNEEKPPLPLIRLRVEYTAPEGGNFDCENPQRFSNRFINKVANIQDVVQFYRKKKGATKRAKNGAEMPDESMLASLTIDTVKVEQLVREFLDAQSLTILPQNSFGDAVSQFIDKDDRHAMEVFLTDNLDKQRKQLMTMDEMDEENIYEAMEQSKSHLEKLFAAGHRSTKRKTKRKPRPDDWDSDLDGTWSDQPAAIDRSDIEDEDDDEADEPAVKPAAKSRGKAAPKKAAAPAKKPPPAKNSRSKKKVVESEEEDEDVVMLDSDEDESQLFVKQEPPTRRTTKAAPAKAPAPKRAPARVAATKGAKQSQLNFSQATTQPRGGTKKVQEVSDDEISDDDDDAFEPAPSARASRSRR